MIPHQTAARSCLSLGLRGTDSFVCTHSFGQQDCAFTVTSALPVLLPGHQSHHTPSGIRSRDFWSTCYVCKGLLNANSSHVCIHPFIHLFCLSIQFSLFFSLFSLTKQGVSVFLIMYCLEMQLKIMYTIVLPPYIITGVLQSKYFLASFSPKSSFDQ